MKAKILGLLAVGLLAGPMSANAVPITYTWSGTGTGSLGGVAFTNAQFTLSVVSDTEAVVEFSSGVLRNPAASASVNVAGTGSATLSNTIAAVLNTNLGAAGISDLTLNLGILFVVNPAFAGYDFASDFGPISGTANISPVPFPTSSGSFTLTSVQNRTASFRSVVRSVPEPGTLALLGLGLVSLGVSRRKKAA